ncbi:MAG: hypothetical protein HY985_15875 [Magnetospirillum sp.]|nr:hypothetical protein [Magnetospirillum sp.]
MATLVGTVDNDQIAGTEANDVLSGLAGLDILSGNAGDDALSGGANIDRLEGGPGNDLLFTEGGEFVEGGAGVDVVILTDSDALDEVFTFTPQSVFGIEGIQDIPDANTTVTVAASVLGTVEGGRFVVAMGDGTDELRVINDAPQSLDVTPSGQIQLGTTTVGLEGIETLVVLGTDGTVTNTFTAQDLAGVGTIGANAFAGPGSAAAEAARLVDTSDVSAVSEDAELSSVADSLLTLLGGSAGDMLF